MATFTITIPNDKVASLLDAFAAQYGYTDTIEGPDGEGIPNPVSKTQFAKNIVSSFIKQVYIAGATKNLDAQRQAVIATAANDVKDVVTA